MDSERGLRRMIYVIWGAALVWLLFLMWAIYTVVTWLVSL